MEKRVTILNETGLHARPAALLVKVASQFKSDIKLEANNVSLNAKSIMNIMSMGVKQGEEINIVAEGPDEREAIDALVSLIESKFNE